MMRYLASILILAAALFAGSSAVLTAKYLDVKLPSSTHNQAIFYDGKDQIYLFGGYNSWDKILRFSIGSETIEEVGILPDLGFKGSVQPDSNGNLFFFGGGVNSEHVYKYDPKTNTSSQVATLPYDNYGSKTIKYNDTSNTVYILGGWEDNVLSFDLETYNISVVATIPGAYILRTLDRIGSKAYGVGFLNRRALVLDLESLQMAEVGPETLPFFSNDPASVVNGTLIYLIGGYSMKNGVDSGDIIQFNSITWESQFLPVSGLKLQNAEMFNKAPASVFVPYLNRIYCFGGQSFNGSFVEYDDIFYFDMASKSTEQTSGAAGGYRSFAWVLLLNLFVFFYQCL